MSDDYMKTVACAEIRHRFERERNDLLDRKIEAAEARLNDKLDDACASFTQKNMELKQWIIASETVDQQRWAKLDDRIYGIYVMLAIVIVGIFLSIIFGVDITGVFP